MDGVATAVDDPGESSGTKKRRRRRARREAATPEPPAGAHGNGSGNGAELAPPATLAEAQVVAVAVLPELEAPVNQAVLVEAPPVEPDQFKDLLGQAVGLRLDSVSREFGGNDEMHVSALRNVSLEVRPVGVVAVVRLSGRCETTLH